MEKKPVWDSEPGVAELINEHKVDVLWDLDWEKITAGFKAEYLRKLLVKIREVKDRIVAVKACLCHYRYYLIGLDHEQYVECWDGGCPFKDLCEQIIWDLEEICTFTISANGDVRLVPEHECVNRIFRTEQAQKLLARLSPEYCRNGRWVKEMKKRFESLKGADVVIGGYSLAGLFVLWCGYESKAFMGVAAASPSVWYPRWMDYAGHRKPNARRVYLSLGDAEAKTKHPVMATVADNITALYDMLKMCPGVRSLLEWNEGGHFREPALRTARAFVWAVGW